MANREGYISADDRWALDVKPSTEVQPPRQIAKGTDLSIPVIRNQGSREDSTSDNIPDLGTMLAIAERMAAIKGWKCPPSVSKDLAAAARLALAEVYKKYDPSKGDFLAYAKMRIRGAILDELRKGDILPRRKRTALNRAVAAGVSDNTGPRVETLDAAYKAMSSSLDGRGLYSGLISSALQDKETHTAELLAIVRDAVAKLPERDRKIYTMYFVDGLTQKEIGKIIGVTTSRVNQFISRIKSQVKEMLPADFSSDV